MIFIQKLKTSTLQGSVWPRIFQRRGRKQIAEHLREHVGEELVSQGGPFGQPTVCYWKRMNMEHLQCICPQKHGLPLGNYIDSLRLKINHLQLIYRIKTVIVRSFSIVTYMFTRWWIVEQRTENKRISWWHLRILVVVGFFRMIFGRSNVPWTNDTL